MLNGTSDPMLTLLAAEMMERRYRKGQLLYMPGDPCQMIFLLKQGRVQQYHLSPEGRKLVVNILKPGDLFGTATLLNDLQHHLFAEALDDCVVLVLNQQRVRELVFQEPRMTLLYIRVLAQRLNHAEEKLEALVFEPIPVRLARCLLEIAENDCIAGYSHQDLSELLGTYRETITVALNHFKEQGLIAIERRHIRILDRAGLESIAHSEKGSPSAQTNGTPPSFREPSVVAQYI